MDLTPADILEKAADVLEVNGWLQGIEKGRDMHGNMSFCAMGAIEEAMALLSCVGYWPLFENTVVVLGREVGGTGRGVLTIPIWNDSPTRTKDQVIDAMKHAAKEYRNAA